MLAPGECLISPVSPEPGRVPAMRRIEAERPTEPHDAPIALAEELEPRSFLLTLLPHFRRNPYLTRP